MDMNRYFDKLFETDQIAIQTIMNELVELQEKYLLKMEKIMYKSSMI